MPTLTNPILRGFFPDPSVCRVGQDFYLACSSFEFFPGVPLFHSRDLANWHPIGHALTRASQLPLAGCGASRGIFAPTLRHHAGVFYLITTNVGQGGNFLVTATDPAGPWSEPVWIDDAWFDPSLLFDADGKVYYTRRGGDSVIVQAEISPTASPACAAITAPTSRTGREPGETDNRRLPAGLSRRGQAGQSISAGVLMQGPLVLPVVPPEEGAALRRVAG